MKLTNKVRSRINRKLFKLPTHHETPGLALAAVLDILKPESLWAGLVWVPKTGTVRITVMHGTPDTNQERELENTLLIFQTHEMPSGRTELTAYMS